jgi:hypothetical protein
MKGMNFSETLEELKCGRKVAREGWAMNIYLKLQQVNAKDTICIVSPSIKGVMEVWRPESEDLLAVDWCFLDR